MHISKRALTIITLFSVGMLHAVIFGFLEYPTNFFTINVDDTLKLVMTFALYITAALVGAFNYLVVRKKGLKNLLIWGLFFYLTGMILFSSSHWIRDIPWLLYCFMIAGTMLFGTAFSSVVVSLTTYIILEFPKHIGIGITVLFAFMNLGAMLSPLLLNVFVGWQMGWFLTGIIAVLILISSWFIVTVFFDPKVPKKFKQLRKGSLVWKEMHYRFALFILGIVLYGFCENTFNLWGEAHLMQWLDAKLANETISFFWLFLIIGQIFVILPLHYFPLQKVFYFLALIIIASFFGLAWVNNLSGFIVSLSFGGIGCSACFPILLAMIEMELKEILKKYSHKEILPFLEISIGMMFAGYILGVGIIGVEVELESSIVDVGIVRHFYWGAISAFLLLVIVLYLSFTSLRKITSKF